MTQPPKRALRRWIGWGATTASIAAAMIYFFQPQPVAVELARVERGPLRVTIDEDGKTRVKERYVVSAPLAGRLLRIELHAGDPVRAQETLLAEIRPVEPQLLDARSLAETDARVRAAHANQERAGAELRRASEAHELARHQLDRGRGLLQSKTIPREEWDRIEHSERQAAAALAAAEFAEKVAVFENEMAQAALVRTRSAEEGQPQPTTLPIRAPVDGRVLRVLHESEHVVVAGAELLEIGDLRQIEAEIDLLSADAVRVRPGAEVFLERWGGEQALIGRVRRVEPSGFMKVSALGVEEQRVNVLVDLAELPPQHELLGDGFRVEARIVIWQSDDVLKVPSGALFRSADQWSVFVTDAGRARLAPVEIGHNNGVEAEVLGGLAAGDQVVLFPSDRVQSGVRISEREAETAERR